MPIRTVDEKLTRVLSTPIEGLELSRRAFNILQNKGVIDLEDLASRTEAEIRRWKNCGKLTQAEIKEVIGGFGLYLGTKFMRPVLPVETPSPQGTDEKFPYDEWI